MSQRPSDGLGKRLAYYRKLSGMSAEQLSQKVPMSRAVIANIESGRKKDVTVDEMLALAWALDIPPVALALPIEQPNVFLNPAEGTREASRFRAWSVIEWFLTGKKFSEPATPQQMIAHNRIKMLLDYVRTRERVDRGRAEVSRGDATSADWVAILPEQEAHLKDLIEGLTGLGVDLTDYKIDETGLGNSEILGGRTIGEEEATVTRVVESIDINDAKPDLPRVVLAIVQKADGTYRVTVNGKESPDIFATREHAKRAIASADDAHDEFRRHADDQSRMRIDHGDD